MGFTEALKQDIRRKAHFRCCLCHTVGVEVHHVQPSADGGSDDADNAAPLCPTCHEVYGANPLKRKFIKEARHLWFEICAARFLSDSVQVEEMKRLLSAAATKRDLDHAINTLTNTLRAVSGALPPAEGTRITEELFKAAITEASVTDYLRAMYPTVRHCGQEEVKKLTNDLRAVGYDTIGSLHRVVEGTDEALADVARAFRDRGETTDHWFDSLPVRLFLPLFDERYCRTFYPKVHANHANDRRGIPWRRPEVPPAA